MRVNILTVPHVSGSKALTPVLVNRRSLKEVGIDARILYDDTPDLYDADCVILDGRVYRKWAGVDKELEVSALLERLNHRVKTVVWFDTTDGTGTTQFQFLPYVDKYLKLQVLRDRSLYQKSYYGGRFFSEYYHTEFGVADTDEYPEMTPAPASELHKIGVAWGHPLSDYGRWGPWLKRLRSRLPIPTWYTQRFVDPVNRNVATSFRFGTSYKRETVAFQRQLVRKTADKLGYPTAKIPRPEYLKELRSCKVAVSPFGWGEASYKDFEVIINGAALLKPDMSHMETWPELYVTGETYLPFKWDCSDLEEVIGLALTGDTWQKVAQQAQTVYGRYLFGHEARELFTNRFKEIVASVS